MKKWLVVGFALLATMAFADHGESKGKIHESIVTVVEKPSQEMLVQHKEMLNKYLSKDEVAQVEKNRAEIKTLLEAKDPDWKKIESLNDKNALIMSKAKTEMMKEGFKK